MGFSVQFSNRAGKVVNAMRVETPLFSDAVDKAYDRAAELNRRFGNSVESFKVFGGDMSATLLAQYRD
jgi:hypothetical protein